MKETTEVKLRPKDQSLVLGQLNFLYKTQKNP